MQAKTKRRSIPPLREKVTRRDRHQPDNGRSRTDLAADLLDGRRKLIAGEVHQPGGDVRLAGLLRHEGRLVAVVEGLGDLVDARLAQVPVPGRQGDDPLGGRPEMLK